MKIIFTIIILSMFWINCFQISAQAQDERGYYLVESEKFTPPMKAMIFDFEGKPAEGFLAPDIFGVEHFLNNYRGKSVFLFFYDITQQLGRQLAEILEKLAVREKEELQVIGMAVNNKLDLLEFYDGQKPTFVVIPNGEVFGQIAYGADLGSPRLFAIDKKGIIKRVLPETVFSDSVNQMQILEEAFKDTK